MSFIADTQTLDDLNLAGRYRPDSVFNLFNKVKTRGGEQLLFKMFHHPMSDANQINARSALLKFFSRQALVFPFSREQVNDIDEYIAIHNGSFISTFLNITGKKIAAVALRDDAYPALSKQIKTTITLLKRFSHYLEQMNLGHEDHPFLLMLEEIKSKMSTGNLKWIKSLPDENDISLFNVIRLDHLLRHTHTADMQNILTSIYELDVYIAVGNVAITKKFSFAKALPDGSIIDAENLRHPSIEKAVGNPVSMSNAANVLFLTGANMAGKSTLMKSFGIAVYLAHMGFPVAADKMTFSVKDGIYSSINVPDDLSLGYSHFYAEVKRVRKVAEEICRPLRLVIIFDELFKGTNVKDAYDATLAITEAFSNQVECLFIISTHITEAGETLRQKGGPFQFVYFPSILENCKVPTYTYRLQHGISNDRHGMMIIENERILELIESGAN
ncbi:MAG: DNA mismatch repair protein [Chitinophagaceae bacterium]|nr:DNA mismatch repair protein [Chitinophagaceae bacterium]